MEYWVDIVALEYDLSEYFGFLSQFLFHQPYSLIISSTLASLMTAPLNNKTNKKGLNGIKIASD
jgi:hypothetical protein